VICAAGCYEPLSRRQQAVASAATIVDGKDDPVVTFYKKYGFLELPQIPR
jgi:hypothetical protein